MFNEWVMNLESALDKIRNKKYKIGILGLGYLGLPLLWTFHVQALLVLVFVVDLSTRKNLVLSIAFLKFIWIY